jgi:ABC-type sugar transport system ATPase subunit
MEAIGGIRLADKLGFIFDGEVINHTDSVDMINRGYILTPEKRANGAFKGLSLEDNIGNLYINKLSNRFGFMQFDKLREFANNVLKKNSVKYRDINQSITELSGGNIQKVIIGRSVELNNLKLLVLDEPTAGMDLGAKSEVYKKIRYIVEKESKSVIFISSELDELLAVCDKICIFYEGNIVAELPRREYNKHDILSTAIGKRVQ